MPPKKQQQEGQEEIQVEQQQVEQQQEERPAWLPENFKTPEALVDSYKESQEKIRELATSQREQQERFEAYIAEQENERQRAQSQSQGDDIFTAYETAMENGDYRTALALQAQAAQLAAQHVVQQSMSQFQTQVSPQLGAQTEIVAYQADQVLGAKYDDWGDYKQKVAAEVQADPGLLPNDALVSPEKTAKALERVYKSVKADDVLAKQQQDATQLEADRQRKLAAQTVPGLGTREKIAPADEAKAAWEEIKAADTGSYASSV